MRFAQGSSCPDDIPRVPARGRTVTKTRAKSSRPILVRGTSYFSRPSTGRSKQSPSTADFSHEDAQWFLNLPDKVRRNNFTIEEQYALGGRRDSVILDAADEALYRLGGRYANRSTPSLRSSSCSSRSSITSIYTAPEEPIESAVNMNHEEMKDTFRWLDDGEDLDLTLDDYHAHVADAALPARKATWTRPSFRRTMSLGNMPVDRDSASTSIEQPGSPTSVAPPSKYQESTTNASSSRPSIPATSGRPSLDQNAAHYQDPDARLKLRVYLASPHKFDEAIEFGFPSLQTQSKLVSRQSSTSRRHSCSRRQSLSQRVSIINGRTFLEDDTASIRPDDECGEETSLSDTNAPNTPMSPIFYDFDREMPTKAAPMTLKESFRPQVRYRATDPLMHTLAGNPREMTMRMTLTRPDLRADESVLYPAGDPLALADLPPTIDGDIWDDSGKNRGLKKLWRKVSGKT